MAKLMLFIDGSWLYRVIPSLSHRYGDEDYRLDYGRLPTTLASEVGKLLGLGEADLVRTHLFASLPTNTNFNDALMVERQQDFFDMLKEEFHYEVELFPIDFRGRRLRRQDRSPEDLFQPEEKCVDIALASKLLYFAAIPQAYDVAIVLVGDRDYIPLLQHARRLGKRVAIASVKGACPQEFADPQDEARVKDVDILWLDDLLGQLELRYEKQRLECQSPTHRGDKWVWTTYRPRKGRPFYCPECRERYARERAEATASNDPSLEQRAAFSPFSDSLSGPNSAGSLSGRISRLISRDGKNFGFLECNDGRSFYFNTHALEGVSWELLSEGQSLIFEIFKQPFGARAGSAMRVRLPERPVPEEEDGLPLEADEE